VRATFSDGSSHDFSLAQYTGMHKLILPYTAANTSFVRFDVIASYTTSGNTDGVRNIRMISATDDCDANFPPLTLLNNVKFGPVHAFSVR
jgi:hypothetical protein